jgi:excisionase family DNA binding protein
MSENLLTPEEAAERIAVSPRTLRDWLRSGELRGVKVGKLWRVRPADLEAFIEPASKLKTEEVEQCA